MLVTHGTYAYQFVWPFLFDGELYPAGSWIVVWYDDEPGRMALSNADFADYARNALQS